MLLHSTWDITYHNLIFMSLFVFHVRACSLFFIILRKYSAIDAMPFNHPVFFFLLDH